MTDRYCIANKGQKRFSFSSYDLLSCGMEDAKWNLHNEIKGCNGGNVAKAWNFTATRGVVSGGSYLEPNGCKSYKIEPCFGDIHTCGRVNNIRLNCTEKCDEEYGKKFSDDLIKTKNPCMIRRGDTKAIQKEIMTNGPVVAVIKSSEDFMKFMNLTNSERLECPSCNKTVYLNVFNKTF
jgi:hypothetical protein